MTSNANLLSVKRGCNSVSYDVLYLTVFLLVVKTLLHRFLYDSVCYRVWIVLFQTSCDTQTLILVDIAERYNHVNGRNRFSECSGLVKDYRIRLSHSFQELSTFDSHSIFPRLSHG